MIARRCHRLFSCVCGQAYVHCAMQIVSSVSSLIKACGFQPQLYKGVSYCSQSSLGAFNLSARLSAVEVSASCEMALPGALQTSRSLPARSSRDAAPKITCLILTETTRYARPRAPSKVREPYCSESSQINLCKPGSTCDSKEESDTPAENCLFNPTCFCLMDSLAGLPSGGGGSGPTCTPQY